MDFLLQPAGKKLDKCLIKGKMQCTNIGKGVRKRSYKDGGAEQENLIREPCDKADPFLRGWGEVLHYKLLS